MNLHRILLGLCLLTSLTATATVRYVALNNPGSAAPYTSWATAATNIQDAIDEAVVGDEIVVTNGIYLGGGRVVHGALTNRVVVDKAVTLRSVNGPEFTHIQGRPVPGTAFGNEAVRCVYLTNGASLVGFTLTNGATRNTGIAITELSGGGVWCNSTSAVVSQCFIVGNHAKVQGGGAYGGTFNNCLFTGNSATNAGATFSNVLNNCTIVGNSSLLGVGGAHSATLNNCIVYFNTGPFPGNYAQSTLNFCCTTPQPATGDGNISADPLFVDLPAGNLRLQTNSLCIDTGNNAFASGAFDLDDNTRIHGTVVDIGAFEFQGSNTLGQATLHYVDATSANPVAPYTNWATAAATIQDAVDVALPGDEVLVTNGIYAVGGRAVFSAMTNRVAVDRSITVRSVNGPLVTIIRGNQVLGTNGTGAVRCVYLADGARLSGFTLTNGATLTTGDSRSLWGGGIYCDSSNAIVSNCVIAGNSAWDSGGGVCRGTLINSSVAGNTATGVGGGMYAVDSSLNNCVLWGNTAGDAGGGVYGGTLNNCTLSDNTANSGGGAFNATLKNSIVYFNTGNNASSSKLTNCCTTLPPLGGANIDADPQFVDRFAGNLRLLSTSPCINTGNNLYAPGGVDLDGNPRVFGSTVDIGAYEYQGLPTQVAPYIITQPTNKTVAVGSNATFVVTAGGTSPLRYQWLSNTIPILLATNVIFTVTNAQLSHSGTLYSVTVTNVVGSITSTNALLIVTSTPSFAPFITVHPTNQTVIVGSNAIFTVWASGTAPLSYQWRSNTVAITGATNSAYIITNVSQSHSGAVYSVTVSNAVDSITSSNALLSVIPYPVNPPVFIVQPTNQFAIVGSNVTFAVVVAGSPPLRFQWNLDGATPAWATNYSVTLTNVQLTQAGNYFVTVSNANGVMVSSNAVLTVGLPPTAGTHYVDLNNPNPVPPYTTWETAAQTIQDAIDAAVPGDEIVVADGTYSAGSRSVSGGLENRVVVNKAVRIRSVNGPQFTIIQGAKAPGTTNGPGAVRCVYLAAGATLSGFMLTNGATLSVQDYRTAYGGGVWCESSSSVVIDCVLVGNSAYLFGGGVYQGSLSNCTLVANSATYGAGADSSVLMDCTLTGNSASSSGGGANWATLVNCNVSTNTAVDSGGGANSCTLNNCVLTGNLAGQGGGVTGGTLLNCLLSANQAGRGGGAAGATLTNCTVVGNFATNSGGGVYGFDSFHIHFNCVLYDSIIYDNFAPLYPNSDGSTQYNCCMPAECCVAYGIGNITAEPKFVDPASGDFRLQPDSPCIDAGNNALTQGVTDLDGQPRIVRGTVDIGAYEFQAFITGPAHYVNGANTNPVPPYLDWATAATNIQDAIDVSAPSGEVVVTDGVYERGGRAVHGTMTNRVAVTKPIAVRSVNGPEVTIIQGRQVPGTTNGDGAIRCAYLANGASLSGFTLVNGATRTSGGFPKEVSGGGVLAESRLAVISNCVINFNSATWGGGAYSGTLVDAILVGNTAGSGGGAYGGWYDLERVVLNRCQLTGNRAGSGGGAYGSFTLNNCLVAGNSAYFGGGLWGGGVTALTNTTVVGNTAQQYGGLFATNGPINNCIIYSNVSAFGSELVAYQVSYSRTPVAFGSGNITDEPRFVDFAGGDFRLRSDSPCINAGNNAFASLPKDLDGNSRIIGGTVDMGAYEFQALQPALRIAQTGESITLAWPLWAGDFGLQQAGAAPGYAGGWSNLNTIPNVTTNENMVTLPLDGGLKLFRLYKP